MECRGRCDDGSDDSVVYNKFFTKVVLLDREIKR